jgi:hypothetical protein
MQALNALAAKAGLVATLVMTGTVHGFVEPV